MKDRFFIESGIHPFIFEGEYETKSLDCCDLLFKLTSKKKLFFQKQISYNLKELHPASDVPSIVKVFKVIDDKTLTKIMSLDLFLWNLNKVDQASTLEYDLYFVGLDLSGATIYVKTMMNDNVFKVNIPLESTMGREAVNHPDHYGGRDNPYEAIKVIEATGLGFHLGNVYKYISRAGKKIDELNQSQQLALLKDLKKARWYLDRYISIVESSAEKNITDDKAK
jgi:hypothetical protein